MPFRLLSRTLQWIKQTITQGNGHVKERHTKQMAFVAVLLATLTLIGGCGNQEPSDTATESAPDTEVTTTGATSAAETPVG